MISTINKDRGTRGLFSAAEPKRTRFAKNIHAFQIPEKEEKPEARTVER